MPTRSALMDSGLVGTVGETTPRGEASHPMGNRIGIRIGGRWLLRYDHIAEMSGLADQTIRNHQRKAKANRDAGNPLPTDMPAPVDRDGYRPLFDPVQIRRWIKTLPEARPRKESEPG